MNWLYRFVPFMLPWIQRTPSKTSLLTPVRWYRYRMRTSKQFKLPGCRFVPTTKNTWRVVTSKIPRRFFRERERGKKELKAHRIMKEQLEAKALKDSRSS